MERFFSDHQYVKNNPKAKHITFTPIGLINVVDVDNFRCDKNRSSTSNKQNFLMFYLVARLKSAITTVLNSFIYLNMIFSGFISRYMIFFLCICASPLINPLIIFLVSSIWSLYL